MPLIKKKSEEEKSQQKHLKECKNDAGKMKKIESEIDRKQKRIAKIEQMMSTDLPNEKADLEKAIQMDNERLEKSKKSFEESCSDFSSSKGNEPAEPEEEKKE